MKDRELSLVYSTTAPLRIAVVDAGIASRETALLPALRNAGFRAHGLASATELYRTMLAQHFDIVLLDADLPGENGYDMARHLRTSSDIGIAVIIDADHRQAPIRALKSGADLYIPKPVDTELLIASLRSLVRRLTRTQDFGSVADQPPVRGWQMEADGWCLFSPHGDVIPLTATEHTLIGALATRNGQVITREALIEAMTHNAYEFDPHRLEMTIYRLRLKSRNITGETLPLRTVRSKGYLFQCEVR
ncbi:MAG TPA: response regulator transcription factor [Dyella sp.]|uniref:response regulator transcription factor n=1 Tax=Dyella sp. TaxID=1869338 RepID=UPI002C2A2160|nr:response regulator transcription factor [Dyella sp.]HTV86386.1 response regulator transcription factor [Dyella sp.]